VTTALRLSLTAIVLVNLAFVHATEAASLSWLAPMYAAVVVSPLLARLASSAAYRWTWNVAVIAIFAVLVRHTSQSGARFLLEDGLRLAAVCQVHVLCTLGGRQRPDLLFFNSFLIAVVTAFLTQDTLYSVVFFAYAPLLVVGLSLYAAERSYATGAVVGDALLRAAAALAVTAAVFLVFPRDFRRKGLVVEQLSLGPAAQALDVGFTDDVRIGRRGDASASDAVVLRARLVTGELAAAPTYWRGATELAFDGERWAERPSAQLGDAPWRESGPREVSRALPAGGPVVEVELVDTSASRVFAPLAARRAAFTSAAPDEPPRWHADGTLRFPSPEAARSARDARYEIELAAEGPWPGGETPAAAPSSLAAALAPSSGPPVPEIARLADELRGSVPRGSSQHVVVERMREHLASRTDYLPPGSSEGAADVAEFVSGRAGGHCEHFATALALLLRHAGIPCRVVTGYVSYDWSESTRTLTIRRRDAHAWVEVKDPQAGWYTVDPTPASARAARNESSFGSAVAAWFGQAWDRIVRFDDEARDAAAAWVVSLPGRAASLARDEPFACGAGAALVAAVLAFVRAVRARRVPAAVREYRACLRRLRLAPRPGETPRALVARAAVEGLPRDAVARLETATAHHESERYARS
jgi:transglutaminase-like putative cysteine protease